MTIERDPRLQNLFDITKHDLAGEAFAAQVMSQIDNLRRRVVIGWICVGVVFIAGAWLLAAPAQDAAQLLTQVLPLSLIDLGDRWLAQVISPINSVATLVALGLLGLRTAYKKIFS